MTNESDAAPETTGVRSDPVTFKRQKVAQAFRQARLRVERHMSAFESRQANWKEETITDLLLEGTSDVVTWQTFSRSEESKNGADWVWWWLSPSGECFGMLVQAKRLWIKGPSWKLDFAYKKGAQLRHLLAAAEDLGVPAMYALYLGTHAYRRHQFCTSAHDQRGSAERRATLSMLPGLSAELLTYSGSPAGLAIESAVPLEDLAWAKASGPFAYWLYGQDSAPELKEFLGTRQRGARAVARTVLEQLSRLRMMGFQAVAQEETTDLAPETVFTSVPMDQGHFAEPYVKHVLRGLRHRPPAYVTNALDGEAGQWDFPESVGGMVIVHLAE